MEDASKREGAQPMAGCAKPDRGARHGKDKAWNSKEAF